MKVVEGHAELHGAGHAERHDGLVRDPVVVPVGERVDGDRRSTTPGASDSAASKVSAAASDIADTASGLWESGTQAVAEARRQAVHGAAAAGDTVAQAARDGVDEVLGTIQQRPLVTAGVSLLIGGALAALLPRSRTEDRLMGETADEARARARAAARQASRSARRVAAAVREEAIDQDLTPQAARETATDVGRRVRKAAGDMAEDVAEEVGSSTRSTEDVGASEDGDRRAEGR